MRKFTSYSITQNRPIPTVASTVYNRKALDTNSNIPLINTLNNLTYLISNSSKIRETVANDGALERLVAILHDCHLNLHESLDIDTRAISSHKREQQLFSQKKIALNAWKWTLAFQCLVLTGTRGTEAIRAQVVSSGILPILATILDNFLIYHGNYDFFTDSYYKYGFQSLTLKTGFEMFRKHDEDYMAYLAFLLGNDSLSLSDDVSFKNEDFFKPAMMVPSNYEMIWKRYAKYHGSAKNPRPTDGTYNSDDDTCFSEDITDPVKIKSPREFYLGKLIPHQDDVVWSLQLLAFISKYTYMKKQLQKVELVKSLSFRPILTRIENRVNETPNESKPKLENYLATNKRPKLNTEPKAKVTTEDPFMVELQSVASKCRNMTEKHKTSRRCSIQDPFQNFNIISYELAESELKSKQEINYENYKKYYQYKNFVKELDDRTWNNITSKKNLNIFPLVEKFTYPKYNINDIMYWSSVIMRNSCRKDEFTGVRQCANFSCGKWEEYPRQFAKCRRCKRTKYCSRKCQLESWQFHRYWCHEVTSSTRTSITGTETNTPNNARNVDIEPTMGLSTTDETVDEGPPMDSGPFSDMPHNMPNESTETNLINEDVDSNTANTPEPQILQEIRDITDRLNTVLDVSPEMTISNTNTAFSQRDSDNPNLLSDLTDDRSA
ncbi:hypothetical protein KAFR_0A00620 [Kazachstania africana CBS 2517]|uniref:MYND-type domain-containing protein n=1 Tax=Kazachstania africana (strain ATCC 22294 / BCRC 22015 / CBS 2517 / CECT 1963 / NBRC 1671 / NRRL Y-8276) TaxID=1071382 RepID=H2AMA0_KAZAF|nr:hypothetical protein KAFR_0A00620 [Kazachstania africana CBS 2517]CCF55500.1 hypothetical protein KAFR_0A00620 [Kazachstania africana CBS 2517]